MIQKRGNLFFCLSVLLLCLSSSVFAQSRISSPYSRYGIGDLTDNTNAWNFSMGGTSIGFRSPYHINYINPASYTAFDSSTFVFEGGFIVDYVKLKTTLEATNQTFASVAYLTFGFPVTKWWRTTIGLLPYSNVGYNVAFEDVLPSAGYVKRIYEGSGGINRFFWGNAFKLTKGLSIGFNASYLFGSIVHESSSTFPDSAYYMNVRESNDVSINGLYFDYGIQYTARLKKNLRITSGAIFSATTNLYAQTDHLATTFFESNGVEYPKDTISNEPGVKGTITVPLMFGLGIGFEKPEKWIAGADFKWQNWENFKAFDMSDSLVNSYQIHAGVEVIPDIDNYTNYLKRIRYRLGFTYNSTYLELRGKHLNEYAVSLGFGLPFRGLKTGLNLSAQLGTRGTTQSNLIKESYFKFVLGFSIYERWFVKRKYY
jgi:long-subunit fatty acid transport protein